MELITPGFNTASGRYCCNVIGMYPSVVNIMDGVSIPQAVGTVATCNQCLGEGIGFWVSIPQAVGTVATFRKAI